MEIELGANVKRPARDLTFISVESETVFVLLGHLPGIMEKLYCKFQLVMTNLTMMTTTFNSCQ